MSNSTIQTTENPTIELFMYSMNQEFPVGTSHRTFLQEGQAMDEWSADHHNDWTQHSNQACYYQSDVEANDPLARLILRNEEFGGVVYDPDCDRIYKVNHTGFDLMKELVDSAAEGALNHSEIERSRNGAAAPFFQFLKRAGLWSAE